MKSLTANNFVSDCARDLTSVSFDQKLRSIHDKVTKKNNPEINQSSVCGNLSFSDTLYLMRVPIRYFFFGKKKQLTEETR